MGAERCIAWRLRSLSQAMIGLELLPFGINQAYQRNGHTDHPGRRSGQRIEQRLRLGIQHRKSGQTRKAFIFIGGFCAGVIIWVPVSTSGSGRVEMLHEALRLTHDNAP